MESPNTDVSNSTGSPVGAGGGTGTGTTSAPWRRQASSSSSGPSGCGSGPSTPDTQFQTTNGTTQGQSGPAPPPPPPPMFPPGSGSIPSMRISSEVSPLNQKGPPSALFGAMQKDKKPFTYTPGGINLSEIRSPRMAKRIQMNAADEGVCSVPVSSPSHQNLPPAAMAAMQPQMPVSVFPVGGLQGLPQNKGGGFRGFGGPPQQSKPETQTTQLFQRPSKPPTPPAAVASAETPSYADLFGGNEAPSSPQPPKYMPMVPPQTSQPMPPKKVTQLYIPPPPPPQMEPVQESTPPTTTTPQLNKTPNIPWMNSNLKKQNYSMNSPSPNANSPNITPWGSTAKSIPITIRQEVSAPAPREPEHEQTQSKQTTQNHRPIQFQSQPSQSQNTQGIVTMIPIQNQTSKSPNPNYEPPQSKSFRVIQEISAKGPNTRDNEPQTQILMGPPNQAKPSRTTFNIPIQMASSPSPQPQAHQYPNQSSPSISIPISICRTQPRHTAPQPQHRGPFHFSPDSNQNHQQHQRHYDVASFGDASEPSSSAIVEDDESISNPNFPSSNPNPNFLTVPNGTPTPIHFPGDDEESSFNYYGLDPYSYYYYYWAYWNYWGGAGTGDENIANYDDENYEHIRPPPETSRPVNIPSRAFKNLQKSYNDNDNESTLAGADEPSLCDSGDTLNGFKTDETDCEEENDNLEDCGTNCNETVKICKEIEETDTDESEAIIIIEEPETETQESSEFESEEEEDESATNCTEVKAPDPKIKIFDSLMSNRPLSTIEELSERNSSSATLSSIDKFDLDSDSDSDTSSNASSVIENKSGDTIGYTTTEAKDETLSCSDEESDEEEDYSCAAMTVRLPLKLSFVKSKSYRDIATVLVGSSVSIVEENGDDQFEEEDCAEGESTPCNVESPKIGVESLDIGAASVEEIQDNVEFLNGTEVSAEQEEDPQESEPKTVDFWNESETKVSVEEAEEFVPTKASSRNEIYINDSAEDAEEVQDFQPDIVDFWSEIINEPEITKSKTPDQEPLSPINFWEKEVVDNNHPKTQIRFMENTSFALADDYLQQQDICEEDEDSEENEEVTEERILKEHEAEEIGVNSGESEFETDRELENGKPELESDDNPHEKTPTGEVSDSSSSSKSSSSTSPTVTIGDKSSTSEEESEEEIDEEENEKTAESIVPSNTELEVKAERESAIQKSPSCKCNFGSRISIISNLLWRIERFLNNGTLNQELISNDSGILTDEHENEISQPMSDFDEEEEAQSQKPNCTKKSSPTNSSQLSTYQRAKTHSRLFELLQEEYENPNCPEETQISLNIEQSLKNSQSSLSSSIGTDSSGVLSPIQREQILIDIIQQVSAQKSLTSGIEPKASNFRSKVFDLLRNEFGQEFYDAFGIGAAHELCSSDGDDKCKTCCNNPIPSKIQKPTNTANKSEQSTNTKTKKLLLGRDPRVPKTKPREKPL